ncbi:DUF6879 family protein [Streptomyces blastmyceticus]|uniref:DUF6879 domain-containing protein n=1 Tax=Streptomyces blastmyceticus TaxID=68180 RepID=A0ABN0XRP0_9ACTN
MALPFSGSQNVPPITELLTACRRSAVHLEMRDVYGVDGEVEPFAQWKAGTWTAEADRADRSHWFEIVAEAVDRGVEMRRARIVSEPVTEYIRFEHSGTPLNIAAGEQVRWLPRRKASDIALPGNDLWLFDDQLIRFGHFTGDGALAGHELCDDPAVVKLCATAFDSVWERATPHEEFKV